MAERTCRGLSNERRDEQQRRTAEYVRRLVESAPPLSSDQVDKVRAIVRSAC